MIFKIGQAGVIVVNLAEMEVRRDHVVVHRKLAVALRFKHVVVIHTNVRIGVNGSLVAALKLAVPESK